MRDPLSSDISLYDVLGISSNASNDEIEIAFKKALNLRKHTAQQIANARKGLLDAASRLQEDFFLYSNEEEQKLDNAYLDGGRLKPMREQGFELIEHYDKIDSDFLEENENG